MVKVIERLLHMEEKMFPPVFGFDTDAETAFRNFEILRQDNFDLNRILRNNPKSIMTYGSEFKPVMQLEGLLNRHL